MYIDIKMSNLESRITATDISKELLITACVEEYTFAPSNLTSYVTRCMNKIYADISYQTNGTTSDSGRLSDLLDEDKLLKEIINTHRLITLTLITIAERIIDRAAFYKYNYGVAVFDVH